MSGKSRRMATAMALVLGGTFACTSGTAQAVTPKVACTIPPNPWNFTMTNPDKAQNGMVLTGETDSLSQIFLVKDAYNNPIFAVGHVGGATVFGDHFRLIGDAGFSTPVFDVDTHGTITLTGSAPKIVIGGETLTADDIKWIHDHE